MARSLAFVMVFCAALVAAMFASQPPAPRDADISPSEFSAIRAMADVEEISSAPHPIGSEDILRVRDYLRTRLTALGLDVIPDTPRNVVYVPGRLARTLVTARVHNVVGILKGTAPELPAIVLMSHYDTVPNSPGAADDTAGVAATLEIIANLKAAGPLKRDVIVLFTEGEEFGLMGARAFFNQSPLASRTGLVLNLEARGGGGRAFMFETSENAGELMRSYGQVVSSPSANSLSAFLYRNMPNGTDLTTAFDVGKPGMNFAFIADEYAYHTASATPDRLDRGSLQHMGDQVLALTRAFGNADDLKVDAPDIIYSDVFGLGFVSYPQSAGWALVGILVILIGFTFMRARAAGQVSVKGLAIGASYFIGFFVILAGLLLLVKLALGGLLDVQMKYTMIGRHGFFIGGCTALAFGLALGLATAMRKWLTLWNTWLSGLALLLAVTCLLQIIAPGATIAVGWPLLMACIAAASVTALAKSDVDDRLALFAMALFSLVGATLVATNGVALFLGLGGILPSIIALPAILTAIILFPGLDALARLARAPLIAALFLLGGFAALGWSAFGPASADHPRVTEAFYLAGPEPDQYARVSTLKSLDAWSGPFLASDGGEATRGELFPGYPQQVWSAPAKPAAVPRPVLSSETELVGDSRQVTLRLVPSSRPRELLFLLRSGTQLDNLSIDGVPISGITETGEWSRFVYVAPPATGTVLRFTAVTAGEASLRVVEVHEGWPEGVEPPAKPEGYTPWRTSDVTYAASTLDVSWP
tara:strand:- start:14874 stop:17159 length:2286 start_codon:yes stop_codon:yes gene_type:complete